MEDQDALKPLDPAYVKVMRISAAIFALFPIVGALVLEIAQLTIPGTFIIPALLFAAWLIFILPSRRFARWHYGLSGDRLRIERGYMFYSDTVVPLGRIQHIDVDQGPIMRRYDLATLTVHTAGNHGASVSLPGLRHAEAVAMRENIRDYIRVAQG
ncbi:MAG: PH domain-containing protein [Sphingorhabdus sp.]